MCGCVDVWGMDVWVCGCVGGGCVDVGVDVLEGGCVGDGCVGWMCRRVDGWMCGCVG